MVQIPLGSRESTNDRGQSSKALNLSAKKDEIFKYVCKYCNLVLWNALYLLEGGDLGVGQVLLPVEGWRAVVCQQLAGELCVHALGEELGLLHLGLASLHPDHVAVWGVGQGAGNACLRSGKQDQELVLGGICMAEGRLGSSRRHIRGVNGRLLFRGRATQVRRW